MIFVLISHKRACIRSVVEIMKYRENQWNDNFVWDGETEVEFEFELRQFYLNINVFMWIIYYLPRQCIMEQKVCSLSSYMGVKKVNLMSWT